MPKHLIQILLPVADNNGQPFPPQVLENVKETLVSAFGGVTAFERSPAQGVWAPDRSREQHEQVITLEVMVDAVDENWWKIFRVRLEKQLNQAEIVVRAFRIQTL